MHCAARREGLNETCGVGDGGMMRRRGFGVKEKGRAGEGGLNVTGGGGGGYRKRK